MDDKLRDILDELDEKQTSILLENEMHYDVDKAALKRIKASVHKRVRADRKQKVIMRKILVSAAAVLLVFSTYLSFGSDNISDTLKQVFEYIPGYGMNNSSGKGSAGEIPQQVLDMVENRRVMNSLTKEKYTIGEKGYRVNHIDFDKLYMSEPSLEKLMTEEERWLFIIENKGSSYLSMLIGKYQGKYDVLMYGGGAEMFYHTLALADPMKTGKVDLLAYGGDYYFISEESQIYQIPDTRSQYERNPSLFDHPISEKIGVDLILANYDDYMNADDSETKLGSVGLVEQHHEEQSK